MTGESWSQVVKKRKPKKSRQAQRDGKSQYAEKLSSDRCSLEAGEQPLQRERVSGARRIWGTLRSTTVAAVTTALSRLTTVGSKLQVRRKYKTGKDNRSRWWYIVKGAEEDLCELDSEWNHVHIQTSWKLEACFKPMQTPLPLSHTKVCPRNEADVEESNPPEETVLHDVAQSYDGHPLVTSPQGEVTLGEVKEN